MESVLRATAVFMFLTVLFRFAGQRTLSEMTAFDFVLLLIVSEATQNTMIGNDSSLTNGVLVILTLMGLDIVLSLVKARSPRLERWLDGLPLILVEQGRPFKDRLIRSRIDEADILAAARERQGLERMEQIKYAVLEIHGGISIIPK